MAIADIFKEKLRSHIASRKITKVELSKQIGVSRQMLDRYLNPKGPVPSLEIIEKIAKTLNISVEFLLTNNFKYPQEAILKQALYWIKDGIEEGSFSFKKAAFATAIETKKDLFSNQSFFKLTSDFPELNLKKDDIVIIDTESKPKKDDFILHKKNKKNILSRYKEEQNIIGIVKHVICKV